MANQPKKYKKFVATAATATLVASAIVPVASAASLSDIAGNTHEEAITALVDAGVINGYPDGTFQPNKTLTRSDVVKLLGKFLVSKGHSVPEDYKTNVRFNDLTSASNDELLKYAAVVYDAGVFNGSNGNLLAADNITRENMAVVLVRAFDTLNNIDLVSYVQDQDYKKEVKDLYTAKAEARAAIEVLDFFDITSVANFNPKGSTTRGHFATFLYNTMNADFSAVTGVANSAVSEIKAINNTTVEVTFKDAVDNIEALDFTIEGLEVKNAVVKQTDAKTVVLTTAAQTGDTVYTLNVNAAKAGTFKGISAVIPTAIKVTTPSVQGTIGQQVTVKAEVTVPAGQSKAGIPVTFNIVNDNANLNEKIEVVSYTNEEGVATYTYTRYYEHNDNVVAYATEKSSVSSQGKVYWNTALSVTDITEGSTIANAGTKVYKVKSDSSTSGYVAVTFKENIGVSPDKVVNGVTFADATVYALDAQGNVLNTNSRTPFEVTTGGHQVALVKLNANGEAQFTLTGSDATVTPVVYHFAGTITPTTGAAITKIEGAKYSVQDLQAQASTVKFEANQTAKVSIVASGSAAAAARNVDGLDGYANQGGREYTINLTGNDGKAAPKGTSVTVMFQRGTSGNSNFNQSAALTVGQIVNGEVVRENPVTISTDNWLTDGYTVQVDDKGQAKIVVRGNVNDYATPIAVYNNGKTTDSNDRKLDSSDAQNVGEMVSFGSAKVGGSKVQILDATTREEVTSIPETSDAIIRYTAVDQNGFPFYNATSRSFVSTFAFDATFANYTVTGSNGTIVNQVTDETNRKTYRATANNGVVELRVAGSQGNVNYRVTTTDNIIAAQSGAITFTSLSQAPKLQGNIDVSSIDLRTKEVTILVNGAPVELNYANADLYIQGIQNKVPVSQFEAALANGGQIVYNAATSTTPAKFEIIPARAVTAADAAARVSNAVSEAEVLAAVEGLQAYEDLSPQAKVAAVDSLWADVQGGRTFNASQLINELVEGNYTYTVTAADYTPAVTGSAPVTRVEATTEFEGSSTGTLTISTDSTDVANPADYNGVEVEFELNTDATVSTIEISHVDNVFTVTLPRQDAVLGGVLSTVTGAEIATALEAYSAIFDVTNTTFTNADVNELVGETLTLEDGVNAASAVTAAPASLSLTFSSNVNATAGNYSVTIDGVAHTGTLAAPVTGDDEVVLTFASAPTITATSKVTAIANGTGTLTPATSGLIFLTPNVTIQ